MPVAQLTPEEEIARHALEVLIKVRFGKVTEFARALAAAGYDEYTADQVYYRLNSKTRISLTDSVRFAEVLNASADCFRMTEAELYLWLADHPTERGSTESRWTLPSFDAFPLAAAS